MYNFFPLPLLRKKCIFCKRNSGFHQTCTFVSACVTSTNIAVKLYCFGLVGRKTNMQ